MKSEKVSQDSILLGTQENTLSTLEKKSLNYGSNSMTVIAKYEREGKKKRLLSKVRSKRMRYRDNHEENHHGKSTKYIGKELEISKRDRKRVKEEKEKKKPSLGLRFIHFILCFNQSKKNEVFEFHPHEPHVNMLRIDSDITMDTITEKKALSFCRSHTNSVTFLHELPISSVLYITQFMEIVIDDPEEANRKYETIAYRENAVHKKSEKDHSTFPSIRNEVLGIFRPWNIVRVIFPHVAVHVKAIKSSSDLKFLARYVKSIRFFGGTLKSNSVQALLMRSSVSSLSLKLSHKGVQQILQRLRNDSMKEMKSILEKCSLEESMMLPTNFSGNSNCQNVRNSPGYEDSMDHIMDASQNHDDTSISESTCDSLSTVSRKPLLKLDISESTVFKHQKELWQYSHNTNPNNASTTPMFEFLKHISFRLQHLTTFVAENCENLSGLHVREFIQILNHVKAPIEHFHVSTTQNSSSTIEISDFDGIQNWPLKSLTLLLHNSAITQTQSHNAMSQSAKNSSKNSTSTWDALAQDQTTMQTNSNHDAILNSVYDVLYPLRTSLRHLITNIPFSQSRILFDWRYMTNLHTLDLREQGVIHIDNSFRALLSGNQKLQWLSIEAANRETLPHFQSLPNLTFFDFRIQNQ